MRLLLVEDTRRLAESLERGFREEGMTVERAATGREALAALAVVPPPELVILDLGLPDVNGVDVLVRARRDGYRGPILVLTARDAVQSRVEALDAGADDYVIKPAAFAELCARVRALARRSGPSAAEPPLACGDLQLEPDEGAARVAGQPVHLSPTERSLLACLLRRRGRNASRREILVEVFGYDFDPGTNVIDVHIAHLRRKLAASTAAIQTVRGLGYFIAERTERAPA
jgi:two-component system, OmpR family, response regulator QseB